MSEESFLVANDTYMKAGVHIGTKFKTKFMEPYIYKVRGDGLAVLNVQQIDKKVREAVEFLTQYSPEDIVVTARRENAWKPAKLFGKATGINIFAGRYQPGRLTNTRLETFMEAKVLLITDAWLDRNAIKDAKFTGMTILGLCDTNNDGLNIDKVIPCNNKGGKSLGLVFYLLAREYCKAKGIQFDQKEEDYMEE